MTNKIIIFFISMSLVFGTVQTIRFVKLENKLEKKIYESKKLEQNNDSSSVKIGLLQDKIGVIKLLKSKTIIKYDTIFVEKEVDTVFVNKIDSINTSYKFSTKYTNDRFSLTVNAKLLLPKNKGSFSFKYFEKPNIVENNLLFNKKTKLLSSNTIVNGILYKNDTNIYDKFYDSIYDDFISKKSKKKYSVNLNVSLSGNFKGEILPTVGIGFGYNLFNF